MLPPVLVLAWVCCINAVTFPKEKYKDNLDDFGVCLRSDDPILPCLTSGAVKSIEAVNALSEIDLGDGLMLVQDYTDESIPLTLSGDPREARTLVESIGLYMEQRYLHWDLSTLFPGLVMRVGPSARGNLQFFLDKRRMVDDRALSTGGLLLKRTVLPVLLGIKLNVASLIPILFAGLIILVKKALILSKFSILLSGLSFFRRGMSSHGSGGSSSSVFGGGGFGGGGFGGGGSFGGGSLGGGGLGSFSSPPKHIIVDRDRPFDQNNVWFARENLEA